MRRYGPHRFLYGAVSCVFLQSHFLCATNSQTKGARPVGCPSWEGVLQPGPPDRHALTARQSGAVGLLPETPDCWKCIRIFTALQLWSLAVCSGFEAAAHAQNRALCK